MSLRSLYRLCQQIGHGRGIRLRILTSTLSGSKRHGKSLGLALGLVGLRFAKAEASVQETLENFRHGNYDTIPNPEVVEHFRTLHEPRPLGEDTMPHPIWSEEEVLQVEITHTEPELFVDHLAYHCVQTMRKSFDWMSGFNRGQRDAHKWLNRICFLETVAGVPGMVAAMTRHLHSLRRMKRDYAWIHTLLEEAENERMHLMTALQLKQPSLAFRATVIVSQGIFVTVFSLSYLISPRFCHRFVGYLEEEAVKTYSKCLEDIDHGSMGEWQVTPAPIVAKRYWKLEEKSTMRDVILAIRADEAHHRLVNHTLGCLREDDYNPYKPGK